MLENLNFFDLFTAVPVYTVYLSYNFNRMELFRKKNILASHLVDMDTDPDPEH
jgi:hypothetical protein